MAVTHAPGIGGARRTVSPRAGAATLLASALVLAGTGVPAPARAAAAAAQAEAGGTHLDAARRQAAGQPALAHWRQAWCNPARAPADAAHAEQALQSAEAAYRAAAYAPKPAALASLRLLVVQRECAAFHATRLAPERQHPVWLLSALRIVRVQAAARPGEGPWAEAVASNIDGPVVNSRITFSQGLHMACFAATDARGTVRCQLLDTHPHGPPGAAGGDDAAHHGPLIATLAGSVSPTQVVLPAVVWRSEHGNAPAQKRR